MTADFADTRGCAIDPRGDYPRVSAKSGVPSKSGWSC